MGQQLLEECFILKVQILSESTKTGTMKIRGIFQKCDEKNNNNRIYSRTILEREIGRVKPLFEERRLLGELDHPSYDSVKLSNASHLITNLYFKGNEVIGEAEILSTPAGKVAQALIKDGVKIGISSRGLGSLSEGKDCKIVNDDYKLVTFDLVADPSTKGAFPGLTESTEIKNKVLTTYNQAMQENVFITLLKNKLDQKFNNE